MVIGRHGIVALAVLGLMSCGKSMPGGIGNTDWPGYGGQANEQHFSPLGDITDKTVNRLGLAWSVDIEGGNAATLPIAVDGVVYYASGYSVVHAVDATTGKILWIYDPEVLKIAGRKMRQGWGSRGISYDDGKIFTGTADGRLIAVDARTGKPAWSAQTMDSNDGKYITGAPRVIGGNVIIGNGGADSSSTRGYVTAYDLKTGKQAWRFFIVPGNPKDGFENTAMAMAAKTWSGEWWKYGGGGHAWNAFAYDTETDTVFVGTGNGAPWNQRVRSNGKGDNLFLCSIIALDAKTGAYKWHYQVNPGETWDYNAAMDIHLADIAIDGKPRKVLMQAPKNGFLYVIDRTNGKLISADKIAKVTWATSIDIRTGRPVEVPGARFPNGKDFEMWPSAWGAHSWQPSAFSPSSGLMYVPLIEKGWHYNDRGFSSAGWQRAGGNAYDFALSVADDVKDPLNGTGWLVAFDPVNHKMRWKLKNRGMVNGGILATAGNLVFQGKGDGNFTAYSADSGTEVWNFKAQAPIFSAPISYTVKGKQYITVLAGSGTAAGTYALPDKDLAANQVRRVLTFVLDGKAQLPVQKITPFKAAIDSEYRADPAATARGIAVYGGRCGVCHGYAVISADTAPDLRGSSAPQSFETFEAIVRKGALQNQGMPRFDELTDRELNDVRQYLRSRADDLRKEEAGK